MASTNLEDVPSVDLMTELLRRMKCSSKPDKRLILIDPKQPFECYRKLDVSVMLVRLLGFRLGIPRVAAAIA
ncbi:hypothetical protein K1719_045429 [Acacia pycnantha]|nr:hypothetical protein K1719_045429 [Acacia pycnantha]